MYNIYNVYIYYILYTYILFSTYLLYISVIFCHIYLLFLKLIPIEYKRFSAGKKGTCSNVHCKTTEVRTWISRTWISHRQKWTSCKPSSSLVWLWTSFRTKSCQISFLQQEAWQVSIVIRSNLFQDKCQSLLLPGPSSCLDRFLPTALCFFKKKKTTHTRWGQPTHPQKPQDKIGRKHIQESVRPDPHPLKHQKRWVRMGEGGKIWVRTRGLMSRGGNQIAKKNIRRFGPQRKISPSFKSLPLNT